MCVCVCLCVCVCVCVCVYVCVCTHVCISDQIPIKDSAKRSRVAETVNVVLTTESGSDGLGQCINENVTFSDVN